MSSGRASAAPPRALSQCSFTWSSPTEGLHWCRVDLDDMALLRFTSLLDDSEVERAARFRYRLDRDRFAAAHIATRLALAEVIDVDAAGIRMTAAEHGKPMLSPESGWVFNLSHSGAIGLVAVARRDLFDAVGIDVEVVRELEDWQALANECFSVEECRWLDGLAQGKRARALLRIWTRKEACLKALGCGFTVSTRGFTTGVDARPATTVVAAAGAVRVEVRTLFEDDCAVAAVAWCPRSHAALACIMNRT